MHGHPIPDWPLCPARVFIGLVRMLAFGGRICPGLAQTAKDALGPGGVQPAFAAAQAFAFAATASGELGLSSPYTERLSADERALHRALVALLANNDHPAAGLTANWPLGRLAISSLRAYAATCRTSGFSAAEAASLS